MEFLLLGAAGGGLAWVLTKILKKKKSMLIDPAEKPPRSHGWDHLDHVLDDMDTPYNNDDDIFQGR